MKKRWLVPLVVCVVAGVLFAVGFWRLRSPAEDVGDCERVDRAACMRPDYAEVTIPPNICPLNFVLDEPGEKYFVKISGASGTPVEVWSRSGRIAVPAEPWRTLLEANRSATITYEVYVKDADAGWRRFRDFTNTVVDVPIDRYLLYREMPTYSLIWKDLGLYERDLEGYGVRPILQNKNFSFGCLNCHTVCAGTRDFAMNVRRGPGDIKGGLFIAQDGEIRSIVDTSTRFNPIPAIYISWHPGRKAIVFSTNMISQSFHSSGESRHSIDTWSDLGVYLIEKNMVTTHLKVARPDRLETTPCFSPDGKYVYFCTVEPTNTPEQQKAFREAAREAGDTFERHKPYFDVKDYNKRLYDMVRVPYDVEKNTWGDVELLLSCDPAKAADAWAKLEIPDDKKAVLHNIADPKVSPDGRFVLFCVSRFGNFSAYQESSDLYLLDLETRTARPLGSGVNSDHAECYHSWSSNSRWIAFSSKRPGGLMARPWFAYVDADGNAAKPFILPQEDPAFYDEYIRTFNVPVLIPEPVPLSQRQIVRALYDDAKQRRATLDPKSKPIDSTTGATALEHAKH